MKTKFLILCIGLLSFCNILNAQDGELKGEIIFCDQQFIGDGIANKPKTDFKAGAEIYGRIKFDKPMKDLFKGYFSGCKLKVNNSEGSAKIIFKVKYEKNGETVYGAGEKILSLEDLNNNYVDFDIAPAINKSRDSYLTCFAGPISRPNPNPYIEEGEKGKMKFIAIFLDDNGTEVENQNISGPITIDYSDPKLDINGWYDQINKANREDVVAENKNKVGKKPNIQFSNLPFSSPIEQQQVGTKFKAGSPIYARVTLDKPLKEYMKVDDVKWLYIKVTCQNYTGINGLTHQKKIRPYELEKNYIDFDVTPTSAQAKDVYDSNMGFHFSLFSNNNAPNKVVSFEIELDENNNNSSFARLRGFGTLELDYTGLSGTQVGALWTSFQAIGETAIKNADKMATAEGAEMAKNLPLPVIFTKPTQKGYAGYPDAQILQMIKNYLKVTEVYMLTYGPNKEQGDFFIEKDSYGLPTAKVGNIGFYFIFKDTDGYYKANGGYLIQPYSGGGKYGAAYIKADGPIMEGDAKYTLDVQRDKAGFHYVFIVDGAKVKK